MSNFDKANAAAKPDLRNNKIAIMLMGGLLAVGACYYAYTSYTAPPFVPKPAISSTAPEAPVTAVPARP